MDMDAEWFDAPAEGGRFLVAPALGPQIWDASPLPLITGAKLYRLFPQVCRKWENAQLTNGEIAPEFDADLVERVHPNAVFAVVTRSLELATFTEDERKNLSSQSRSPDNATDSTAQDATVQTDTSPEESPSQ